MTTSQPHRPPPRRDPPCNCCPKPCQQFLLRQRYEPQQGVSIFVVVFSMMSHFFLFLGLSKMARSLILICYFAFINVHLYPLKDSLVDRGTNVSRFPPLYFEYLGNVRENNNSRKSGRNNIRLLPVLQTMIQFKDGSRATLGRIS